MTDTPDILRRIVEVKRREVERLKVERPVPALEKLIEAQPPPLNLAGALWGDSVRIIAEVKKASPAKGLLRPGLDVVELASSYVENGAAAISVLTNVDHFQGSIEDLERVHGVAAPQSVPVLRKEFIFDPYQVFEARAHGADAILLIVAMLTRPLLRELMEVAKSLWLQCLVEVHDEGEIEAALEAEAEILGDQQPRPAHLRDRPERHRAARQARAGGQDRRQRERHRQPGATSGASSGQEPTRPSSARRL